MNEEIFTYYDIASLHHANKLCWVMSKTQFRQTCLLKDSDGAFLLEPFLNEEKPPLLLNKHIVFCKENTFKKPVLMLFTHNGKKWVTNISSINDRLL